MTLNSLWTSDRSSPCDPPASVSSVAGIRGMSHKPWPTLLFPIFSMLYLFCLCHIWQFVKYVKPSIEPPSFSPPNCITSRVVLIIPSLLLFLWFMWTSFSRYKVRWLTWHPVLHMLLFVPRAPLSAAGTYSHRVSFVTQLFLIFCDSFFAHLLVERTLFCSAYWWRLEIPSVLGLRSLFLVYGLLLLWLGRMLCMASVSPNDLRLLMHPNSCCTLDSAPHDLKNMYSTIGWEVLHSNRSHWSIVFLQWSVSLFPMTYFI